MPGVVAFSKAQTALPERLALRVVEVCFLELKSHGLLLYRGLWVSLSNTSITTTAIEISTQLTCHIFGF